MRAFQFMIRVYASRAWPPRLALHDTGRDAGGLALWPGTAADPRVALARRLADSGLLRTDSHGVTQAAPLRRGTVARPLPAHATPRH